MKKEATRYKEKFLWLPKKLPTPNYNGAEWKWLVKTTIEQVYCKCGIESFRWIDLNWAE
jgi:hypothetical protein